MDNQRILKFRVWCKTTRHFTNIPFYSCAGGQLLWLHTGNVVSISNINFDKNDDYIIQQFAGFKDRNNKEIYEGDIVEYVRINKNDKEEKYIAEVEFIKGEFYPRPMFLEGYYDSWDNEELKDFKVLGNIFENPKLLDKISI
jgi:uncharacterized phage protein (TIGR01671 family)